MPRDWGHFLLESVFAFSALPDDGGAFTPGGTPGGSPGPTFGISAGALS